MAVRYFGVELLLFGLFHYAFIVLFILAVFIAFASPKFYSIPVSMAVYLGLFLSLNPLHIFITLAYK